MTTRSSAPALSWRGVRFSISLAQHLELQQLVSSSGLNAAQHIRLAVLEYLSEDESVWAAEAAALARQGRLAQTPPNAQWLSVSFSPEHRARLLERTQSSGLPLRTQLRMALGAYLARASENAPAS